jgi:hypothetical protein
VIIYTAIGAALLLLATSLSGIAHWGAPSWWQGVACGLAVAAVWYASRIVRLIIGLIGLFILFGTALGGADTIQPLSKAFFNGMSIAMVLGLGAIACWRWATVRTWLVAIARQENIGWLLRLLGERS